ncbi:MAG: hypothetical protein ACREHD_18335 [Pirellulales bacterium]
MTVYVDIFPRQALAPGDYKALGRSIRRWLRLHAKQQGSVHWYDSDSLGELLKGRPPLSVQAASSGALAERSLAENAGGGPGSLSGTAVLDHDEAAPPPFGMDLVYNKIIDERQILANVRRALSTELVADVHINGRSWDEPAGG